MGSFSELSGLKQLAALVLGAALITGGLHFTVFKSQREANAQAQSALELKLAENSELESYAPKLKDMDRQLANLKQQLEIERKIVGHNSAERDPNQDVLYKQDKHREGCQKAACCRDGKWSDNIFAHQQRARPHPAQIRPNGAHF